MASLGYPSLPKIMALSLDKHAAHDWDLTWRKFMFAGPMQKECADAYDSYFTPLCTISCKSMLECKSCTYYSPCVDWISGMIACLGQSPTTFASAAWDLCGSAAHTARVA